MSNKELFISPDAYLAAYVTAATRIEPIIQPVSEGLIGFSFDDVPEVHAAVAAFNNGAAIDAKRYSGIVARNFALIRSCNRRGCR